jgi:glutathione S-transferase
MIAAARDYSVSIPCDASTRANNMAESRIPGCVSAILGKPEVHRTMQLIGMLDSPYVRRVAIALRLLDLPFEHRNLSVFRGFDAIRAINPVAKVPTFVCDDGLVLTESGLILEHLEDVAGRSLWPTGGPAKRRALQIAGLALASCEKSGAIVYERARPAERQHEPWHARVRLQARSGFAALEAELAREPLPVDEAGLTHAGVAVAVAWRFAQLLLSDVVPAEAHPVLAAWSEQVERLPALVATPPDENFVATRGRG